MTAQDTSGKLMPWGKYKGCELGEIPTDYLDYVLSKWRPWTLPFGQHKGTPIDDVPSAYLDWLAGQSWLGGPLRSMIENELLYRLVERHLEGRPDWHNLDEEHVAEEFNHLRDFSPEEHVRTVRSRMR